MNPPAVVAEAAVEAAVEAEAEAELEVEAVLEVQPNEPVEVHHGATCSEEEDQQEGVEEPRTSDVSPC